MARDLPMKEIFGAWNILRAIDPDTGDPRLLRVEDDGTGFYGLRIAMYNWTGTQWAKAPLPAGTSVNYLTTRTEVDANGNPIYIGNHETFQADPADTSWVIEKFSGWAGSEWLREGPVTGSWNLRATYF